MLDIKRFRNDFETVETALKHRGHPLNDIASFTELDIKRRELLQQAEQLKNQRNVVSQDVAKKKKAGENADDLIKEMREVSDQIKTLDEELRGIESQLEQLLLTLPNILHASVPVGKDEDDNVEIRRWGDVPTFDFEPQAHWDIATNLDIVNFEAGAKVSGSRFLFYKGLGARLERALINFMMDLHCTEHGYEEMLPPMVVNRDSMVGSGQLPKFEEDAFKLENDEYFLTPTAEVPVVNFYREEILSADDLPKNYVAYSACFRSEAGSAGRDTRGLIRLHQFNKVELLKFVKPEDSYDELEKLTENAEKVLQLLKLPYRILSLCTGDIGFTAAKTYDLEVWLPQSKMYREISSCSNCEDYQARRAGIRFRRDHKSKPEFVHTLNGSGLAIGRTVAAILENYQQADGTVKIPEVLQPYMNHVREISIK
ncbi:serine--tRNA ligase [Chengkuizengella sediminis]|uniref:serine--tRNA ligase n=1 Tax=Chengkuizengella sediminis TaxID=1885917 RepID=UPI00138A5D49|nr:serine--tRNA ligase [Chengkuizengella sediminis]NDI36882.1 serine--tRNA ligase [Chengkuizengella sediminis]